MPDIMNVILIAAVAVIAFFTVVIIRDSNRFVTVTYKIDSDKVYKKCRMVMLSDLHNKEYGKDNRKLLEAIEKAQPDLIVIAGDMLTANKEKTEYEVPLKILKKLAEKYPVYYGIGNHEYRMKVYEEEYGEKYREYMAELEKSGVRILENEKVCLPEYHMEIYGLEIEKCYYRRLFHTGMEPDYVEKLLGKSNPGYFQVLLAHNPDYFKEYALWGADLVLAGHIHGGVMRLPLLGGVVSPMMRLFPKYDGGRFEEYGKTMILGRGLGMHTIPIRVFNPGELIIVEVEALSA